MQQLRAEDAGFVYLDAPSAPMHVGLLGLYDPATAPGGSIRFKQILAHVTARLSRAPAFRRRLVRVPLDLDHPHWIEDPDFDVEYHIRHIALPQPADWRQLCIQVSRLHARPMDLHRPLWEFTIIEGLEAVDGVPPGAFALFAKTHLAAIDADRGDRMIAAVHDATPTPPVSADTQADDWQPDSRASISGLLVSSYFNTLRKPFQFAETLARSLPDLARRGAARIRRKGEAETQDPPPPTPFDGPVGPHRVFDAIALPIADLQRIGALAPGSSIDDVILAIVGGALDAHLARHDLYPDASLIALHLHAGQPMTAALATRIADPVERLRTIVRATGRTRAKPAAPAPAGTDFAPGRIGSEARLIIRHAIDAPTNTAIAQIGDSSGARYFAGARLIACHALMPVADALGLVHSAVLHDGTLRIAVTADRAKLPDPAAYRAALAASFADLKSAADAIRDTRPSSASREESVNG